MDVRVQHGVCAGMSHRGTAMARRRVRRATILSSAAGLAAPPTPRASSAGLDLWRGTAGSGCTGPGGGACGARRAKHQMRWEDGARPGPIELLPRPPRALHIPLSPILPEQRGGQGAGRRWRAPGQLRESGVWRSRRSWTTTLSTCRPRCAGSGSAPPGRHVAFGVQAAATTTRSSTRPRGADGGVAYFLAPAAAATAGYTAWPSLRPPSSPGDLLVVLGDGAAPAVCSSGTGMVFLDSSSLFPSTFDFLHLYSGVTSPWIDFSI
jgi:hypothetical protein